MRTLPWLVVAAMALAVVLAAPAEAQKGDKGKGGDGGKPDDAGGGKPEDTPGGGGGKTDDPPEEDDPPVEEETPPPEEEEEPVEAPAEETPDEDEARGPPEETPGGGGRPDDAGRPNEAQGSDARETHAPDRAGGPEGTKGRPDVPGGQGRGDEQRADRANEKRSENGARADAKADAKANKTKAPGAGKEKDKEKDKDTAKDKGKDDADGEGRSDGRPGGSATAAAIQLERASLEDAPGRSSESRALVRVLRGGEPVEVAQGEVQVEPAHAPEQAFVVLVMPDGREVPLGRAASAASWNTSAYENGYYTVEVREEREGGNVTVASTRVLVANPRATPLETAAALATGTVVTLGAGALASRGFDVAAIAKQAFFDVGGELAEDRAQRKVAWGRARATRSALLIAAAAGFLALFKVLADREQYAGALPALGVALLAVFLCTVAMYAAEWGLARQSGARARFRFWVPGALSLAASALLFRSAFGYPGYVEEEGSSRQKGRAAVRGVGILAAGFALAAPFLLVGVLWRWDFAEQGVAVTLMMTAAAALPFAPMPGHDLWSWRRLAWLPAFVVAISTYVLWELAFLSTTGLVVLGVAGLAGYASITWWLGRPRAAEASDAAPSR